MRRWRYALATACAVILSGTAIGQTGPRLKTAGGEIVARRPCDPAPTYDAVLTDSPLSEWCASERPSRTQYVKAVANLTCTRITYSSDGLRIVGFIDTPRVMPPGRRYPITELNLRANDNSTIADLRGSKTQLARIKSA